MQDTANADDVFNELIQKYPAREAEVRPYISGTSSGGTRRSGDDSQDTVGGDNAGDEDSREPGSSGDIDRTGGGRLGFVE